MSKIDRTPREGWPESGKKVKYELGIDLMKHSVECMLVLTMLGVGLSGPLSAQQANESKSDSIEPDAMAALNRMGAYLRTLKDFQVIAEVTTEDVLDNGEKLQFGHTTNIVAHMPNQLRADETGEQHSRLFLYDGSSFTLYARRVGYYVTVKAPPTLGELVDVTSEKYDIEIPLVDLFLWGGAARHHK